MTLNTEAFAKALAAGIAAYDAAVADNSGWIEWAGGECPVEDGTKGQIRLLCGSDSLVGDISLCRWSHSGELGDIIAYRLAAQ